MPKKTQPAVGLLKQALILAEKIQSLQGELDTVLAQVSSSGSAAGAAAAIVDVQNGARQRRKPKFSAAARARIAAAQKARWAKFNKAKGGAAPVEKKSKRKKPKFSAEARERIAAAQRARWAKVRKAKAA